MPEGKVIFTIGHGRRPIEEFLDLLKENQIEVVADVRSIPRSRNNPQFNQDVLPQSLAEEGIAYVHIPRLGGFRPRAKDSPHTALLSKAFQGYADHMLTDEFASGLAELEALASERRCVVMCAESYYRRCHRSMISDALLTRGWRVVHILDPGNLEDHRLHPAAREDDGHLIYDTLSPQ